MVGPRESHSGPWRTGRRMIDLVGKTAVVFGLANKRSIAWGIALKLHAAGAAVAICYQNERMKLEPEGLIAELPAASRFHANVPTHPKTHPPLPTPISNSR